MRGFQGPEFSPARNARVKYKIVFETILSAHQRKENLKFMFHT